MQFITEPHRISAINDEGKWVGEISFPPVAGYEDRVVAERVFVAPEGRGQGLAGKLTQKFVDYAHENHLTVKLMCPYVKAAFAKHPEYQDLLLPEDRFE
ncbi:MAG: GNAT family N-acetyltransferase [Ligilactobacillus agilis]|nr:GNAT family N-acetyltransferase [Ligilactobacillus agilis]